jgi:mRNA interferase HicA
VLADSDMNRPAGGDLPALRVAQLRRAGKRPACPIPEYWSIGAKSIRFFNPKSTFRNSKSSNPQPEMRKRSRLINTTEVFTFFAMNAREFKRWLSKQGATFQPGKGSHLKVYLNGKQSVLPMHSAELKSGLVEGIKKQLGLKGE